MDNTVPQRKKVILSGIQPTGVMTLGNYLGALKNWVALQDDYNCAYMIADLHALTVRQNPADLRKNTLEAYALMLACGVNPEKSIAFVQSHNKCHTELSWVLNCYTQFGELGRMTQFKDKSAKHADNINAGLFTYPVLMASDILVYQADLVPVGDDQRQHLEITRDIAERFNGIYGNVFTIPQAYTPKLAARIMSLQEPTAKMSKSDENINAFITLLDKPEAIIKKFKRAITDSDAEVAYREGKYGINNLMSIYSAVTGLGYDKIEQDFTGKGYGDFKQAVGEAVAESLRPIRENFDKYMSDKAYLEQCIKQGAEKAEHIAQRTVDKAYKKVGLLSR